MLMSGKTLLVRLLDIFADLKPLLPIDLIIGHISSDELLLSIGDPNNLNVSPEDIESFGLKLVQEDCYDIVSLYLSLACPAPIITSYI